MYRLLMPCFLLTTSLAVAQDRIPPTASITENGEGKVSAVPDQGRIRGGVVTVARTAAGALAANASAMDAVRKALGSAGVDLKADVQTVQFSIEDHYTSALDSGGHTRTHEKDGYTVTHKLDVRVKKLDDLGPALDAMVAAGANDIDAIRLDSSEADKHRDTARVEAVDDARRRAEMIAGALGYRLGDVVETSEVGGRDVMESAPRSMALSASASPTAISGGSLEYRSRVYVKWGLIRKTPATP
jgi:uncharacterized protein